MKIKIIFITIFLTFFTSCSIRKMIINEVADVMDFGVESIMQENDLRIAEISLLGNLKLIETLSKANPDNKKLLLFAAMGYGSYALGFLEDTLPERASNLYFRAKEYGLRILRMNEDFKKSEKAELEIFQNSLRNFSKDDVPYLFWTAYNWGNLINLNIDDPEIIADFSKVNALMERVLTLDESYYFAGSHLYFGTLYAKIPRMLGGNLEKSKEHFDRALKLNEGKFLMSYVYYAKMYAVADQDKDLFINLLNKVIDTPLDILPQQTLPNLIAKQKAQKLIENMDNYF